MLQVQQGIPDSITKRVTNAFYEQLYPQIKLQSLIFPQTHLKKSCPLPCKQHLPQHFPQSLLPREYKSKEIKTAGLKTAPHYFSLWLHLINLYLIVAYSIFVILINIFKSLLIQKRQLLEANCSLNYKIFWSRGRTVFRQLCLHVIHSSHTDGPQCNCNQQHLPRIPVDHTINFYCVTVQLYYLLSTSMHIGKQELQINGLSDLTSSSQLHFMLHPIP